MDVVQTHKVISLVAPVTQTSTTTGSAVDVEVYNDDAMAIATIGTVSGGSPSVVVTITGSLTATPSTYDQTLATFTAATAAGIGAVNVNLSGIKNVKGVATQTGAGNVPISIVLVAQAAQQGSTLNSATLA